ncbi:hypothetical protein [Haloactinomyces albus]|uniref:Uncharacterized protein n=1 Tax=Haloactinomyces albus TaxID=1352928 RepID=A0AAE4CNX6_9ACTN|nr:hypothetical protein [Haloactinomyces albus]MDR7302517.1 hypothetical protein [Haloactinomyces albus]
MESAIIPLFLLLLLIGGGAALTIVLSRRKRAQRPRFPSAGYGYSPTQYPSHQAPPQTYGYPSQHGHPPVQPGCSPQMPVQPPQPSPQYPPQGGPSASR